MKENWKDITGFDGMYQVSNLGRIRSLPRIVERSGNIMKLKGKVLKQHINTNDYPTVNLCKNGIAKVKAVHIIVAKAFIPNPNNLPQVNHKDGSRNNCCSNNLEWVTNRENGTHRTLNITKYSKFTGVTWCKSRKKWLSQIRINGKSKFLGRFIDEAEAAQSYTNALVKYNLTNKYATTINKN